MTGPPIYLFTDFGTGGPYLGQMTSALKQHAPDCSVINLMCDAPFANPKASGYLLSALSEYLPVNFIVVAVVDPGVGSNRKCLCLQVDDCWYLGPDNGLLAMIAKRYPQAQITELDVDQFLHVSSSFHGRDIFAPAAGAIYTHSKLNRTELSRQNMVGTDWVLDLPEIIYIDGFGNAMTGLIAKHYPDIQTLAVQGQRVARGHTFSDAPHGMPLFYENSIGLWEIAVNLGNAAKTLGLQVGDKVAINMS